MSAGATSPARPRRSTRGRRGTLHTLTAPRPPADPLARADRLAIACLEVAAGDLPRHLVDAQILRASRRAVKRREDARATSSPRLGARSDWRWWRPRAAPLRHCVHGVRGAVGAARDDEAG